MTRGELADVSALAADLDRVIATLGEARLIVRGELGTATAPPDDPRVLAYIALTLAQYYNALEDALERSARVFEGGVPAGESWHTDLLRRAAMELPHLRPPVIPPESHQDARTLLRFRHFMRHAYAVRLDPRKIAPVVEAMDLGHPQLVDGLQAFRGFLERLLEV